MSRNCSLPLFSGIGNIIQSLPFAFEMKKRYSRVTAFGHGSFRETNKLVEKVFDQIYRNHKEIPKDYRLFKHPKRRSFSEYKGWFVDNKEKLPDKFNIDFIGYKEMSIRHKTVVWPEGRSNWICKRWLHWPELVSELEDVAVVGLMAREKRKRFKGSVDYRGKLSLPETGGLIRNASIFIGNEGGISHYAAALGIRTYIIYGCTDPIKTMPPNNAICISKNLPCQPCQFTTMVRKGITFWGCKDRKCLDLLTAKDVLEVVCDSTNTNSV